MGDEGEKMEKTRRREDKVDNWEYEKIHESKERQVEINGFIGMEWKEARKEGRKEGLFLHKTNNPGKNINGTYISVSLSHTHTKSRCLLQFDSSLNLLVNSECLGRPRLMRPFRLQ